MKITKNDLKKLIKEELEEMSNPVPTEEAMDPTDKALNQLERLAESFEDMGTKYLMKIEEISASLPKVKALLQQAEKKGLSDMQIAAYVLGKVGDLTGMGRY
jgi:hypothetical protein